MSIATRRFLSTELIAVALAFTPGLSRAQQAAQPEECPASPPRFRVGHTVRSLTVPGTFDPFTSVENESRPIEIHVWYPAREQDDCGESPDVQPGPGGCHAPLAVYTSRLNGALVDPLSKLGWSPLSWTILAAQAYEGARLADGDGPFPVIVFSHGNQNEAIDYAYTLEALASYGYIVAAPDHLGNTQDEVRIDFANDALSAAQQERIPCLDGAPPDPVIVNGVVHLRCSRASVPKSMIDRYRDVETVLDALPSWFPGRVDMDRVGVMGHSRGTITALSLAGGSSGTHQLGTDVFESWGRQLGRLDLEFPADARIKGVMGLAIGAKAITFGANVQEITVPTLLVAGTRDINPGPAISALALGALPPTTDRQLVLVQDAVHRHFDSGYCAQLQSSGSVAQRAASAGGPAAALDRQTAGQILLSGRNAAGASVSGDAIDFCGYDPFSSPTDITPFADAIYATAPSPLTGFTVTPSDVPTHGLTSDTVKATVVKLAAGFFGQVLNRADGDARPIRDCLSDELADQPPVPPPSQQELDAAPETDDPD